MSPETIALIDRIDVTLNAGGMNTINIVLAFVTRNKDNDDEDEDENKQQKEEAVA